MTRVIERAQADVAAGRLWKARDRLAGFLANTADDEILALLGETCFSMGDLPAAGAAWFALDRHDDDAVVADAAWRERHGHDAFELWRSLPPSVRERPSPQRIPALAEAAAEAVGSRPTDRVPARLPERMRDKDSDLAVTLVIAALLALLACAAIGAWTVLRWLLP